MAISGYILGWKIRSHGDLFGKLSRINARSLLLVVNVVSVSSMLQDCGSLTEMKMYKNLYLYGIYPLDDLIVTSSLQQCVQLCQNDSECTVATFSNIGSPQCSIRKTKYITSYQVPSLTSISFVRSCSDPVGVNLSFTMSPPSEPSPHRHCVPCLIGAASGTFVIVGFVQLGIVFFICRRKNSTMRRVTLAFTFPFPFHRFSFNLSCRAPSSTKNNTRNRYFLFYFFNVVCFIL
ncbi:unnamed protein product [Vicia faba]|uniref:Apple domain-containing protein n=1 Tax=Vicia faba TaxID=3906 RepID=A0AAV0Z2L6_VICFA|nr:unnamed protein product [Vicia faba]